MESLEDAMKKREDELSQLRTKLASLQVRRRFNLLLYRDLVKDLFGLIR